MTKFRPAELFHLAHGVGNFSAAQEMAAVVGTVSEVVAVNAAAFHSIAKFQPHR